MAPLPGDSVLHKSIERPYKLGAVGDTVMSHNGLSLKTQVLTVKGVLTAKKSTPAQARLMGQSPMQLPLLPHSSAVCLLCSSYSAECGQAHSCPQKIRSPHALKILLKKSASN